MKNITLFALLSVFSLTVFATEAPKKKPTAPPVYFTMNKGKLIEVNKGHRRRVRKDVTLTNMTTIHPNGAVDAGSGQSLQLHDDEFMTLDGRITKLKYLYRHRKAE